jgi:hypothetical protein
MAGSIDEVIESIQCLDRELPDYPIVLHMLLADLARQGGKDKNYHIQILELLGKVDDDLKKNYAYHARWHLQGKGQSPDIALIRNKVTKDDLVNDYLRDIDTEAPIMKIRGQDPVKSKSDVITTAMLAYQQAKRYEINGEINNELMARIAGRSHLPDLFVYLSKHFLKLTTFQPLDDLKKHFEQDAFEDLARYFGVEAGRELQKVIISTGMNLNDVSSKKAELAEDTSDYFPIIHALETLLYGIHQLRQVGGTARTGSITSEEGRHLRGICETGEQIKKASERFYFLLKNRGVWKQILEQFPSPAKDVDETIKKAYRERQREAVYGASSVSSKLELIKSNPREDQLRLCYTDLIGGKSDAYQTGVRLAFNFICPNINLG